MANRYYLVPTTTLTSFRLNITNRVGRDQSWQILQVRTSYDGTLNIVQAETNDSENTWAMAQTGVVFLGYFNELTGQADQAVWDYINANPAVWRSPHDGL